VRACVRVCVCDAASGVDSTAQSADRADLTDAMEVRGLHNDPPSTFSVALCVTGRALAHQNIPVSSVLCKLFFFSYSIIQFTVLCYNVNSIVE